MNGSITVHGSRHAVLDILRIGPFRRLSASNGLTFAGLRVQEMAVAWTVLELTGSKLTSGIANGIAGLTVIFFVLVGGMLADRYDRQTMVRWTRLALSALMFLLAAGMGTGHLALWQIVAMASLATGVYAMDLPIARTLIYDHVGRERLVRAVSLNSIAMDGGAVVLPWLAGRAMASAGPEAALVVMGAAYAVASAALFHGRPGEGAGSVAAKAGPLRTLLDGIAYIKSEPGVARLVALGGTVPLAGVFFSMMPTYSREVLHIGATGLGAMIAAYSVGAIAGSVAMAVYGEPKGLGRTVLFAAIAYALAMAGFALSQAAVFAFGAVLAAGVASAFWKNSAGALVQTSVDERMRSRVMSVFSLGSQMVSVGWLAGGILSTVAGNVMTLVAAAVAMVLLNLWAWGGRRR